MTHQYDDAYLRANADALRREDDAALEAWRACHRLTPDERDDLATFVATRRPELIRYGTRLEDTTWPIESMTIIPPLQRATTRISVQPPTTGHARSSGASSCRRSTSASASSAGRSGPRSGNGWADAACIVAIVALLAGWYLAVRAVGGA